MVLGRTVGSKGSLSAPVCSNSPDAVPIDSSVHQVLFKYEPAGLHWTTSSSATTMIMIMPVIRSSAVAVIANNCVLTYGIAADHLQSRLQLWHSK